MTAFLVGVAIVIGGGLLLWQYVKSLEGSQKEAIKDSINAVFERAERRGTIPRAPAFDTDYAEDYPGLLILEENYETLRDECLELLQIKDRLANIEVLGGGYTKGGIHSIAWKNFMFKSGRFIEENCELAPKSTALLEQVPGLYTAFFSIIDPHQYVTPHFGYYKGFLRYHLGIIIPNDNADQACWLRVNPDEEASRLRQRSLIDKGEKYYWKNGEGVIFDDTFLHDASNESDEVRVVLWLDIRRNMPWYLQLFNIVCLAIVHREPSVARIRKNARVAPE